MLIKIINIVKNIIKWEGCQYFVTNFLGVTLVPLFRGQKRGLHDLIAGTVVIIEPAAIQEPLTRAEREAALDKMDEIQTEYHGL